jgi:hypothetical protein
VDTFAPDLDWLPRAAAPLHPDEFRKALWGDHLGAVRLCKHCGRRVRQLFVKERIETLLDVDGDPMPAAQVAATRPAWWWHDRRGVASRSYYTRDTERITRLDAEHEAKGQQLYVMHPCEIREQRPAQHPTREVPPPMTAPQFETFVPPVLTEGDTFKPHEHIGAALIVKVLERKNGVVTPNTPEGGPAVIVDLVDLTDGNVYRDVLWMGGSFVDALTPYVGKGPVVIGVESRVGKSGRAYAAPLTATPANIELAQSFYTKKGDPFVQAFATTEAAPAADASNPPW